MHEFDPSQLKQLYTPPKDSHKGDNGKLLIIGGSRLFHAASLWALAIASKIVDMVFYSSVPENNHIVHEAKASFRNGIVVPREKVEDYINEAECVLIGPGMPRMDGQMEGEVSTQEITEELLRKFPDKRWVIDGGSLQVMDPTLLLGLKQTPILTPHQKEFEILVQKSEIRNQNVEQAVEEFAKKFNCVVVLKGEKDIVCSPEKSIEIPGGNSGMTKGGTGDVLAGLTAALYCKNHAFLSACAASFFNKKAGESLFERVGYYFNATDLVHEIPKVMGEYTTKRSV